MWGKKKETGQNKYNTKEKLNDKIIDKIMISHAKFSFAFCVISFQSLASQLS